jgi:hypothetical protein
MIRYAILFLFLSLPARAWNPTPVEDATTNKNFLDISRELKRINLTNGGIAEQNVKVSSSIYITGTADIDGAAALNGVATFNNTLIAVSSAGFTSPTSTVTFIGWVDIGWEYITATGNPSNEISCTCPAGKKLLSAGCTGNGAPGANSRILRLNSAGNDANCYWVNSTITTCWAYCARIK